jgi:hypothetical protein
MVISTLVVWGADLRRHRGCHWTTKTHNRRHHPVVHWYRLIVITQSQIHAPSMGHPRTNKNKKKSITSNCEFLGRINFCTLETIPKYLAQSFKVISTVAVWRADLRGHRGFNWTTNIHNRPRDPAVRWCSLILITQSRVKLWNWNHHFSWILRIQQHHRYQKNWSYLSDAGDFFIKSKINTTFSPIVNWFVIGWYRWRDAPEERMVLFGICFSSS